MYRVFRRKIVFFEDLHVLCDSAVQEKPAAKSSGHAEKMVKGIFGKVKNVDNELDGTYEVLTEGE